MLYLLLTCFVAKLVQSLSIESFLIYPVDADMDLGKLSVVKTMTWKKYVCFLVCKYGVEMFIFVLGLYLN